MAMDTGVLAFWIFFVWVIGECLATFGEGLSDTDKSVLKGLQFILGAPAILQATFFTLVDLSASLRSAVKAIRYQWRK